MTFRRNWDEEERNAAIRTIGLCLAALAVFVFIALVSYLFNWKQDMSRPEAVANAAGRLGYATARLLVCDLFGLGSFALLIAIVTASIRMLSKRWKGSLMKATVIALLWAFVSSLALALVGRVSGLGTAFAGGLGGRCGARIIEWSEIQLGLPVSGLIIAVMVISLLLFCSRRFSRWFESIGSKKERTPKAIKASEEEKISEPFELEPEPIDIILPDPEKVSEKELAVEEKPAPEPDGSFEIIEDDGLDVEPVEDLKPIDNRLDPPDGLPKFKSLSLDLLDSYASGRREVSAEELTRNNNKIRAALANYKIQVNDVKAIVGPTVTLYKVFPAPGVKIADIKKLQEDIALSLNAKGVRVITLSDSVGIEVANDFSSIVPLKALLNDEAFRNSKADLPVAIGYTITQKVKVFDLADAPHLLIAGATKQGKSVGLNVIVSSLLYSKHPSELKFVFIDPKMVEFSSYSNLLKHYLAVLPDAVNEEDEKSSAIVKRPKDAEKILRSLCIEMDDRYELLSRAGVNNIKLYNAKYKERRLRPDKGHRFLPYLVVVVDEYADLTMTTGASADARAASRSITNSIIRLAQKGRAAGLHVILATQRPSVDVISGIIKSNFPMRIAFRVASRVDSMTILDTPGAEKLIGKGDMLFSAGIDTERIQCGYISGEEIDRITDFVGAQTGYGKCYNTPCYLPTPEEKGSEEGGGMVEMGKLEERFEEAARMVVQSQRGSTSDLQRKLGMGYAKAGRVMDQLQAAGIVGPQEGSKPRQVLVQDLNSLQEILDAYMK
ncbi:MAG: DNA translocase FtsK [Bacteroidales bacterium]|nr:DNA translocase FtsK [Bacteroidales bacterium]